MAAYGSQKDWKYIKSSKVTLVQNGSAVKIGFSTNIWGNASQDELKKPFYNGNKYITAKGAAREWASWVSACISHQYRVTGKSGGDGYGVSIIDDKATITSSEWSIYDRAYRRSLKIFKQILP